MTMRGSWLWLIEIEGLGRDGLSANNQRAAMPMAMTSVPFPGNSAFASTSVSSRVCDDWQPVLQPESVKLSAMSFSPFAGKPGAQTLSFEVALPDELPEIARFFLSQPLPVATITAPIDPTDSTITMTDTSSISAGDVIFVGAEAFRVRVVDSGTQVTINASVPGGASSLGPTLIWPESTSVNVGTRGAVGAVGVIGAIGTRIAQHDIPTTDQPPPWPDTRVYLANPRVKGRRIYLRRVSWGLNGGGFEGYREQLFGQFLVDNINVNSDGTTISVNGTSLVTGYGDQQLGARGVSDRIRMIQTSTGASIAQIDVDTAPDADDRRIWKDTTVVYSSGSEAGLFVGSEFLGTAVLNGITLFQAIRTSRTLGLKLFAASVLEEEADAQEEEDIRFISRETGTKVKEVLVSDPLTINRDTTGFESTYPPSPTTHPYYSLDKPGGAGILSHPFHLLLAHLGQFESNLPQHWQIRLDRNIVSTASILQLAEEFPVSEWPGVCVVGPVKKALEWLSETFLRPLGCGWVTDEFGRLSVASITIPRLSPWSTPETFSGLSSVRSIGVSVLQPGRQVQRILEAEAGVTQTISGQGLGKEPRLTIQSADAYRVADGDPEEATFEINAMGALGPDDGTDSIQLLDITSIMFLRSITSTIGTYLRSGAIQYTLRIPSSFPDEDEVFTPNGDVLGPAMPSRYALPGTTVALDSLIPGLRKLAGRRLCVVLEQSWQDDCTTQQVRILDLGGIVRIAAAGRVVSASVVSGQLEIVLEPDFEVVPVPYTVPPFGDISEDGETLSAFASRSSSVESVRFFDSTLAERNAGPGNEEQVVSYDVATNTLTTTYLGTYLPVVGDFVLLANQGETDVDDIFAYMGRDTFNL